MNNTAYIIMKDGDTTFYIGLIVTKMSRPGIIKCKLQVKKGEWEEEAEIISHRIDSTNIKLKNKGEKSITNKKGEEMDIIEYYFEKDG